MTNTLPTSSEEATPSNKEVVIPSKEILNASGIYIVNGELTEESLEDVTEGILLANLGLGPKKMQIFISSEGGLVSPVWGLIDLIEYVDIEVQTIAMGLAHSAAAILLAGGTPGSRLAMKNSSIMIHEFSSGVIGQYNQLNAGMVEMNYEQKRHLSFWKRRSKYKTDKAIKENLLKEGDNYLRASDAIKHGIVDKVI